MRLMMMFFLALSFNQLSISAASSQPVQTDHHWCGQEIYQFCRDAQTMPERLRCLEKHKSRLSADCRKKVSVAHQKAARLLNACARDLTRFCQGQMNSYGPASQCLLNYQNRLSFSCRKQMSQIRHYAYRTLVWNSCKPQILSLCYQETTEKGVSACLKNHLDELSSVCQEAGGEAGLWEKPRLARMKSQNPKNQLQSLEP